MSDFKVKHDYTWKRPTDISVKDAGSWKPVKTLYVNNAGVWVPVWVRPGAQIFTTTGTFTVPPGVYSICVAIISEGKPGEAGGTAQPGSGGNGGDGGSLAWKNNIAVTPGQTFSVYSVGGQVNFGALYVLNGLDGVSAGWDVSYPGGAGGIGQASDGFIGNGFPGGGGGCPASWAGVGANGVSAPGGSNFAAGGGGTDLMGVARISFGGDGGNARADYDGGAGQPYGGGGGGGNGRNWGGASPGAGGAAGSGAVRIIWGTGKSFPDNANF